MQEEEFKAQMKGQRASMPGSAPGTTTWTSKEAILSQWDAASTSKEYCCEFVEQEDMVFSYDGHRERLQPDMPRPRRRSFDSIPSR